LCEEHFLTEEAQRWPIPRQRGSLDDHEAQKWLWICLAETKAHLEYVKDMLLSHGDAVLKKWNKKGNTQKRRAELLSKASPKLFNARPEPLTDEPGALSFANPHLPWLDPAAFSQDRMRLLSLLHVRSEYGPDQWAAFDTRSGCFACSKWLWLCYWYNPSAVIMHGERYGSLVDFDANSAHGWQQAGFPRAIMTFLVQKEIAMMLSAIVKLLVADTEPTGNVEWKALVSRGLRSAHDEAVWSSYYHQEFTPPSNFDSGILLEKARNHLNMLVDETELAQTNPDYMRQCVLQTKANTFILFKENKNAGQEWTELGRSISFESTNALAYWLEAVAEAENLEAKLAETKSHTMPGAQLSKEADAAMRCFGKLISQILKFVVESEVLHTIRTMDVMQDYCHRTEKDEKAARRENRPSCLVGLNANRLSDRIVLCIQLMIGVENADSKGLSLFMLIQWLQQELQGVSYNKNVENRLSTVALLDELRTSWQWRQIADHHDPVAEDALERDISTRGYLPFASGPKRWQSKGVSIRVVKGDTRAGQLLRAFCDLPLPKGPKNITWLKKMTTARDHLTSFWQCVRETWNIQQLDGFSPDALQKRILSCMSFDISPEYLLKVEAERQLIEDEDRRERMLAVQRGAIASFVQQPWDIGAGEDGGVRRKLPKKSNASRNEGSVANGLENLQLNEAAAEEVEAVDHDSVPAPQIPVRQDTLSVMAKMFPTGSDGTSSVRWVQLVQALVDTGMTATQGAGSAVAFSNSYGAISLHMPHPEPVVDAFILRGFGKRLNKWFGWTNETFVLRQKESAEVQENAAK
jgi:hypothetical protein